MTRFVVLLRGVNVGKGNRVPMAEFRALLEDLGFSAVRTLLNSGNAVFRAAGRDAAAHATAIAAALQARLGVSVPVIVKSAAEFEAIVAGNTVAPPQAELSRSLVVFSMDGTALPALERLRPLVRADERFLVTPAAAYLHCTAGLLDSAVGEALLGKAGRGVTTRNMATVLKLRDLLQAGD